MDTKVKKIFSEFLSKEQIDKLEEKLWEENCIIYHSELPKMTETPLLHIDATPDKDYALRILRAYRQNCDCNWVEDTSGKEPTNPLLKLMNEQNKERAKILDNAIKILLREHWLFAISCKEKR